MQSNELGRFKDWLLTTFNMNNKYNKAVKTLMCAVLILHVTLSCVISNILSYELLGILWLCFGTAGTIMGSKFLMSEHDTEELKLLKDRQTEQPCLSDNEVQNDAK
jgi:hypothetical protein